MKATWWTPEWENVLVGMLADKTLSATAEEFSRLTGKQFTRSAIAGRMFRLKREGVAIKHQTHAAGGRPCGPQKPRETRKPREPRQPKQAKLRRVRPTEPMPLNLDIFTVGANQCRYPVSGEGYRMLMCGHESMDCSPYCGWHQSIAYLPRQKREGRAVPPRGWRA